MGRIRQAGDKQLHIKEQFNKVDDEKMRIFLSKYADILDSNARMRIWQWYNDRELLRFYQQIRESGVFELGGKSKVYRKVLMIPDIEVLMFLNAVMEPRFGKDWKNNPKALRDELVAPWLVVKTL